MTPGSCSCYNQDHDIIRPATPHHVTYSMCLFKTPQYLVAPNINNQRTFLLMEWNTLHVTLYYHLDLWMQNTHLNSLSWFDQSVSTCTSTLANVLRLAPFTANHGRKNKFTPFLLQFSFFPSPFRSLFLSFLSLFFFVFFHCNNRRRGRSVHYHALERKGTLTNGLGLRHLLRKKGIMPGVAKAWTTEAYGPGGHWSHALGIHSYSTRWLLYPVSRPHSSTSNTPALFISPPLLLLLEVQLATCLHRPIWNEPTAGIGGDGDLLHPRCGLANVS